MRLDPETPPIPGDGLNIVHVVAKSIQGEIEWIVVCNVAFNIDHPSPQLVKTLQQPRSIAIGELRRWRSRGRRIIAESSFLMTISIRG